MLRLSSNGLNARSFAALALVAAASACGDLPSAPPQATLGEVDAAAWRGQGHGHGGDDDDRHGHRHHHRGRYRDNDRCHATGRSGSATLTVTAIVGHDGITRLQVVSGSTRNPGEPMGDLSKVQIKAWSPVGTKVLNANYQRPGSGSSYEYLLPGIPAGSTFQVQANVRGIDGRRTDVVTVVVTSQRGPALSTSIQLPDEVPVGVPTVVTATVRETNGTVGVNTACVLYVDGVAVDRVDEVWVDAGDEVTCAFTHTFNTSGNHDVRVVLVNPTGDPGLLAPPPSASEGVSVVNPNLTPGWTASVMDRTVTTLSRYDLSWWMPNGSRKAYEQSNGESPRSQTINVSATLARATAFPLSNVALTVGSSAAGSFQSATWSGLVPAAPDAQGQSCVSEMIVDQGGHFTLCSTGTGAQGRTTFGYTRFAGTVTYHSAGFSRTWDNVTATETYWTWNENPETYAGGGQMRQLGTSVSIQMAVTDGTGPFQVSALVPLSSFNRLLSEVPYTCTQESLWWLEGGVQTVCEGRTEREAGWSGSAAG